MVDESKIPEIQEIVPAYPFTRGTTLSHNSLNQICEGLSNVTDSIDTKQDVISDLGSIRSGAALGATAVQPNALNNYYTKDVTDGKLATKQNTITDLGTIRSGAALGATAVQPNALNNYYTKNEINGELDAKQDVLTAGDNIQITNNVISATDTKYVAGDFDIKDLADSTKLRTKWDNAATLAASAIQPSVLEQQLSNYLTETEVNALIAEIHSFEVKIVDALPASGNTHTIYFVPAGDGVESDFYNEYMYINGKMELIGNTRIDLSGYYTKDEIDGELDKKQNTLVAGTNIEISGDTISSKVYEASEFDIKDLADSTGLRTKWDAKQDAITDLDDIRSGATLGATAVQESDLQTALSGYYTSGVTDDKLATKQDVIDNLTEIEQNAASGKTAFDSLITKQDVIEDLGTIRSGAKLGETAVQESDLQTALSGYYTSAQTMELIGKIDHFAVKVVDTLPVSGEPNTIYFVKAEGGEPTDAKNEYIYVEEIGWELIGTTRIDLTDYYTSGKTDELLATKQNTITDLDDIRSGAALGETAVQKSDLQTALSGYYTSGVTDNKLATKQDVLTAGSHIEISGDTINVVGLSDVLYTEITYSELVSLVSNSGLTPGMQYRLTDYECTVNIKEYDWESLVNKDYAKAINEGHFDIILVADDESTLNENVRFTHHEGDTYFTGCKLEAWEGKYTIYNDTNKFNWAYDTNGKGVIYWLKDEWNNECPYDFKNIQFKRVENEVENWYYTFNFYNYGNTLIDGSIYYNNGGGDSSYEPKIGVKHNVIKPLIISEVSPGYSINIERYKLPIIIFHSNDDIGTFQGFMNNSFGYCCDLIFSLNGTNNNTFGNHCNNIIFGKNTWFNTFGDCCSDNRFGNSCYQNTFGNRCLGNTFGNNCSENIFGNQSYNNTFGNDCWGNIFGNNFQSNTFGNYFQSNTFGNHCYGNIFGNDYIKQCRFGDGVQYCTISGYEDLDNYGSDYYIRNIVVLNGTIGQDGQLLELNENEIFNTHNFKQDSDLAPQIVCGFFVNENNVMTYIAKYYFTATLG